MVCERSDRILSGKLDLVGPSFIEGLSCGTKEASTIAPLDEKDDIRKEPMRSGKAADGEVRSRVVDGKGMNSRRTKSTHLPCAAATKKESL